ncbi:MAG: hypothetical protein KBT58_02580 [Bizionia sp.]|nr:hypothetical protein [Bizionia sp.]
MAKKNNSGENKTNITNNGHNSKTGTKNIGLGANNNAGAGSTRGSGSGNRPSKPKID